MPISWRKANVQELDLLVSLRLKVLRAANLLAADAPLPDAERETRAYYQHALTDGSCVIYTAWDGDTLAGTGGICFYQVMPTCDHPDGRKAYIMSMYTEPAYRRQGIAIHTLDLLVREATARGVTAISLEATRAGRPLYERYGFVGNESEMELPRAVVEKLTP